MKKVILSSICLLSCLTLVGCGGISDSEATKNLNNQLDRVNNVVVSANANNLYSVTPANYIENENNTNLTSQKNVSLYSAQSESSLQQQILQTTSMIKSYQQNNLKLGNDKVSAINNLSKNISKYLNCLSNSRNDLNNSINKIKNKNNISNTNYEELNSLYVELNSNLKEREAYLENLLTSLEEVENIYKSCNICNQQNNNPTDLNSTQNNI